MEEILASIRRIIADDESTGKPAARGPEPPAAAPRPPEVRAPEPRPAVANSQADVDGLFATAEEPAEDVLELTPDMRATASLRPSIDAAEPRKPEPPAREDAVFDEADAPPRRPEPELRPRLVEMPAPQPETPPERLLSPATDQAVASAFSGLTHLILQRDARTLEDLVKEMLRPLLKSWLDDNLPQLVERLVREEIERVSRERR